MNKEEKEAILELKHFSNETPYWKQEEYSSSEVDSYIKIVLNLIEKQQKEIEELKKDNKHQWKERCKLFFALENSISKGRIREKMKEVKELSTAGYEILKELLEE